MKNRLAPKFFFERDAVEWKLLVSLRQKKMEDATKYFLAAVCVLVASLAAALTMAWFRRHK